MIFFLLHLSAALEVISQIPNSFCLAHNEFQAIELGDYFSGDQLVYSISPKTPQVILSQSSIYKRNFITYSNICRSPTRMSQMQNLNQFEKPFSQFTVYAAENEIYLINTTSTHGVTVRTVPDTINWFSIARTIKFNGVLLMAQTPELNHTVIYFVTLSYVNNQMIMGTPILLSTKWCRFSLFDRESSYLSNGVIYELFAVTGYIGNKAYVGIYYYSGEKKVTELELIILGEVQVKQTIFAVMLINLITLYFPETQQLIQFVYYPGEVYVSNSVYLTQYDIVVTSLELSDETGYLLVGLVGGFMVISMDFSEVYIKKFINENAKVFMASSENYMYLLVQESIGYKLMVTDGDLEFFEIGNMSIEVYDKTIGWGVFNTSLTGFSFLYNFESNIELMYITVSTPFLNITSGPEETQYNLTVTETLTGESVSTSFRISSPLELGYVEMTAVGVPQSAVFDGLKAQVLFKLSDYFCGFCLQLEFIDFELDNEYFDMDYEYIEAIYEEIIEVDAAITWASGMLFTGTHILLYDNSSIYMLLNNHLSLRKTYNFTINQIMKCETKFLTNLTVDSVVKFYINGSFLEINPDYAFISYNYYSVQCTDSYIICQNTSGLFIYLASKLENGPIGITSSPENYEMNISHFHLYSPNYLCAVVNSTIVMLFDVNEDNTFAINVPIRIIYVQPNNVDVYCDAKYVYVVYESNSITMYNVYGYYLKTFEFQDHGKGYFTENYYFSVNETVLQVFNSTGAACGVLLAEYLLPEYKLISFFDNSIFDNGGLQLYFLLESEEFLNLTVPPDYYTALITFTFISPENIAGVFYQGYLGFKISNALNFVYVSIPVNIYTNGETIYKSSENIAILQNSLKNLVCSPTQFSISELFTGQDMTLSLQDPSNILTIQQRISNKINYQQINTTFTAFLALEATEIFLFADEKTILVYDKSFNKISAFELPETNSSISCISFATIYQMESLVFVAGCRLTDFVTSRKNYVLYFFIYIDPNLELLMNLSIPYEPNLMQSSATVGGKFVLMIADVIEGLKFSKFVCNHFQIVTGRWEAGSVVISLTKYMNPLMLDVNYYYIIDFSSYYDPMFKTFYLYLLDWYFGIRVIRIDQQEPSLLFTIKNVPVSQAVALTKCGKELYISTDNTTIIKFYLTNWFKPDFKSQIYLYKKDFHAIPSTLKCSSAYFSGYLIMMIEDNDKYVYLHVINNKAVPLSSIITDVFISYVKVGTYAFIESSNKIIIISPLDSYSYVLNDYALKINPLKCDKSIDKQVTIIASNQNNVTANCTLSVHINKKYNNGDISDGGLEDWVWALIVIVIVTLIFIGIRVSKRCYGKKEKRNKHRRDDNVRRTLFNYEFSDRIN